MRNLATFIHTTQISEMTTAEATATSKATFSPPSNIQRSPWHSPVPYLFGGLAAMLGLIAFALLILACSYWKLSGQINDEGRDVENGDGEKEESGSDKKILPVFEEKFLVIMAGDVKPTFLATPKTSRASSFNEEKVESSNENGKEENCEEKNRATTTREESGEESSQVQNQHQI